MTNQNDDPIIRRFREQISDNDRHLVEAINRRLELVARLKAYKESRGVDFLDPEREEWMLRYLSRANRGPLSAEGLREVYTELLDLTKREVARSEAAPPPDSAAANPQSSPDTPGREASA